MVPLPSKLRRAGTWLTGGHRFTAIAMAATVLYYVVIWGPFQGKASGDGWFAFLYLKAIVFHSSLDMKLVAPEYLRFFGESGPGHHMPNRCPFGPTFIWLPFYLIVAIPELIAIKLGLLEMTAHSGQSPVHIWVAGLGTLGCLLVGWRALLQLFSRHVESSAAELGAAITVWATPMLWYTAHQPFYQHGIAFCIVSVMMEYWDRTRGESHYLRFVYLGALGGYGVSVRAQELVWLAPFAIECAWYVLRGPNRGRWLLGALLGAVVALLAFSPQVAVWFYYSGKLSPVQAEPLRPGEPFFLTALFSTRAGLFPWTPVLYATLLGFVLSLSDRLRGKAEGSQSGVLAAALVGGFLLDLYIVACAWMVASGFSFGSRRLSDCAVTFGFGVALLLHRWRARTGLKRGLIGYLVFCVVLNLGLMETLREQKMSSSGSATHALARTVEYDLHGSPTLVRLAQRIGSPFVEPAALVWSLVHHVPIATFEQVVGTFFLDRDGQWFSILTRTLELTRPNRYFVASGLRWHDEKSPPEVIGPARLVLYMFAKEQIELDLVGTFLPGATTMRWNGVDVPLLRNGDRLHAVVNKDVVRAGTNEVELALPFQSKLAKLEFGSRGGWW